MLGAMDADENRLHAGAHIRCPHCRRWHPVSRGHTEGTEYTLQVLSVPRFTPARRVLRVKVKASQLKVRPARRTKTASTYVTGAVLSFDRNDGATYEHQKSDRRPNRALALTRGDQVQHEADRGHRDNHPRHSPRGPPSWHEQSGS